MSAPGMVIGITRGTALIRLNRTLFSFFSPDADTSNPYLYPPTPLFWLEFYDDQGRRFFVTGGFHTADPAKHLAERIAKKRLTWHEKQGTEVVCEATFRTDIPAEGFVANGMPYEGIVPK